MTRHGDWGFSLIELAIALVVIGIMAAAVPKVFPSLRQLIFKQASQQALNEANNALLGFIVGNSRLPCPDGDTDGNEDCLDSGGNLQMTGGLPYRTLGLSAPIRNFYGQRLVYAVYRNSNVTNNLDADLATAKNRFEPYLPNGVTAGNTNGLDFCQAVRNAALTANSNLFPYVGSGVGLISQAFILADPGATNADGMGGQFDGSNNGWNFELPGRSLTQGYDDQVKSTGFNRLAAELNCPAVMAKVNGAARTAYSADDIKQLQSFYYDFRVWDAVVKGDNLAMASIKVAIAAVNTGIVTTQIATDVALDFETAGALAATTIASAAIAVAATAADDIMTGLAEVDAITALASAVAQATAALTSKTDADAFAAAQLSAALVVDGKGLLQ
jgi:prepilin-type N-terminal cleavage/methylation domain-containing protein